MLPSVLPLKPSRCSSTRVGIDFSGISSLAVSPVTVGSTHTWVPSISCTAASCLLHRRFDQRASSTFKRSSSAAQHDAMRLIYASGGIDFVDGSDSLHLQDATAKSRVSRGGIRRIRHAASIWWFPVASAERWELRLSDILVDSASLGLCSKRVPCTAIIDTGTSGIGGSDILIEEILDRIGALSACSAKDSLRPLSLVFEGRPGEGPTTFTLTSTDYAWDAPAGASPPQCPVAFMALQLPPGYSRTIVGNELACADQVQLKPNHEQVLGNTFLRKYYSIFDQDNAKIGGDYCGLVTQVAS
ncbi:hypothetical protein Esti_005203 [Eimeria stiedai]